MFLHSDADAPLGCRINFIKDLGWKLLKLHRSKLKNLKRGKILSKSFPVTLTKKRARVAKESLLLCPSSAKMLIQLHF